MSDINIYDASLKGDVKALEKLLRANPEAISAWDKDNGMAPIHWTANGGKLECIALLLELGADVGAVDRNDHITPLHIVVARGFAACAKLLIDHGADVNALSKRRESPLHVACWAGHVSCVKILLEHNAVVNMKDADYGDTPLHKASEGGHVLCVKCLLESSADVNMRNRNGNTPLHYAAKSGSLDCFKLLVAAGADVCARGQDNKRPFNFFKRSSKRNEALLSVDYSMEALTSRSNELWFTLIQSNIEGMGPRILEYVTRYPNLAFALDASGRCALDVASPSNRLAIHSSVLWHGRYRIIDEYPEHISPTCIVYRAVDEAILDSSGHPIRVAIKLMKYRDQFSREIEMRNCGFDSDMIVDILCCNPSADSNLQDYPEQVTVDFDLIGHPLSNDCETTKALAEQVYCTVMPLAEKSLFISIKQENLAQDMEEIRRIIVEIAQCVDHCHSFGILHGDINPMNIVRVGKKWKLIDLDNASRIGEDAIGEKLSSAFAPPEAFYVDRFSNNVVSRTINAFRCNVDVDILIAHPSYDIWSLGCVLYQLLSVESVPLFVTGKGDNLSTVSATDVHEDNIWTLVSWSDEFKAKKLSKISDPIARNLLSQMLHKEPRMRPTIARVLAHPFLSLRNVPRLIGEQAEYDVYMSHRGAPDTHDYAIASELYRELLQRGLRVWWAPLSLSDEAGWRDEFSPALINARVFIPFISRNSLNHPTNGLYNVRNITQDSVSDDLLLEYRLAVELRDMGFIDQIFPVMIGDVTSLKVTTVGSSMGRPESDEVMAVNYSNYFFSGCFPRAPNTPVDSLEADLMSHFELLGIGVPLFPNRPVSSVLSEVLSCTGAFVEGDYEFRCPDPTVRDSSLLCTNIETIAQQLQDCPDIEFGAHAIMKPISASISQLIDQLNEADIIGKNPAMGDRSDAGQVETDVESSVPTILAPDDASSLYMMMNEIKAQKEANRELRQQLVPLMASQKNAWEAVKMLKEENERTRRQYAEQVAQLECRLSVVADDGASASANGIGVGDDKNTTANGNLESLNPSYSKSGKARGKPVSGNGDEQRQPPAIIHRSDSDDYITIDGSVCGSWAPASASRASSRIEGGSATGILLEEDEGPNFTDQTGKGCTNLLSMFNLFFAPNSK